MVDWAIIIEKRRDAKKYEARANLWLFAKTIIYHDNMKLNQLN